MVEPPNGVQVRLARVESDYGRLDGRTRAVEESSFRIEERFRTLTTALQDVRGELRDMAKAEDERREREIAEKESNRRVLIAGTLGIIASIIAATITVIAAAPH